MTQSEKTGFTRRKQKSTSELAQRRDAQAAAGAIAMQEHEAREKAKHENLIKQREARLARDAAGKPE